MLRRSPWWLAASPPLDSILVLGILATFFWPLGTFATVTACYKLQGSPLPKWGLLGLAIWLCGVGFAYFWVIAQIIASV